TASTNGKKATANSAAPLAGQSSKPTAVSKNAQRPLAVSSATRPVSSAHAALPVTVVAHGGSGHAQAIARAEPAPAPTPITLAASSVDHGTSSSASTSSTPSNAPSNAPLPPNPIPAPTQWQRDAPGVVALPAKIPSPFAAPPLQAIPEPPIQTESLDRDQVLTSEARRALRQVVPRIAAQAQSEIARV